jgi:hypothetical protein
MSMPTDDFIEHKPPFDISSALFVVVLILMCLCEMYIIRGLWFRQTPSPHGMRGSDLAFAVWCPGIAGFMLRLAIGKRLKKAKISSHAAALLNTCLGGLLLMAYLLMARFAEIAFS